MAKQNITIAIGDVAKMIADRAEGLLNDEGVDFTACLSLARDLVETYVGQVDCNLCQKMDFSIIGWCKECGDVIYVGSDQLLSCACHSLPITDKELPGKWVQLDVEEWAKAVNHFTALAPDPEEETDGLQLCSICGDNAPYLVQIDPVTYNTFCLNHLHTCPECGDPFLHVTKDGDKYCDVCNWNSWKERNG